MAWSQARSQKRIEGFLQSVPKGAVNVQRFDDASVIRRRADINATIRAGGQREDLIFNVGTRSAVVVEGAHIYVQLLDFSSAMLEQERETEAGHKRVLSMLHLHYAACDRVAEEFEAQRVDYHGPRMHAVIVSPAGREKAFERAARALAFADAVQRTIGEVGARINGGRYSSRVRIGVDSGTAVAVNSGRAGEPEPLFLGDPANYAAKLAEGQEEGIFPSNRIRRDLGLASLRSGLAGELHMERASPILLNLGTVAGIGPRFADSRVGSDFVSRTASVIEQRFSSQLGSADAFSFHRHTPPLREIDFKLLSPSNSVRMELVSIFGDLDRFTAYVGECIRGGRVAEMVTNLHVIRGELAAALKQDFNGRKVRFIGDCIHGLLAEGTSHETDSAATVARAVEAAAGMRSSFDLCQQNLDNIDALGLAIGLEFGATPITRIGIRGDRSVRCSVSKAVSASEARQRECDGEQTAIGPRARRVAPHAVSALFNLGGFASGLNFECFANAMDDSTALPAPAVASGLFRPSDDGDYPPVRKEGGGTYG